MKQYHMLIVDDDVFFRKYLNKIISKNYNEIKVLEFPSAKHALNHLGENIVDFILTDISMPQMTGVEFIKHLKENSYQMPCAVLSSYDDFSYVRETLKLGAVDYLLKHDTSEADICRVIESCIEKCILIEQEKSSVVEGGERILIGIDSRKYIQDKISEQEYMESLKESYVGKCYNKNYFVLCRKDISQRHATFTPSEDVENVAFEYTYFENANGEYIYIIWFLNTENINIINEFVSIFSKTVLCCDDGERIGISEVGYKIDKLSYYYEQALEAKHQALMHERYQVVYPYVIYEDIVNITKSISKMEEKLNESRILDREKVKNDIERIMDMLYSGYYRIVDWEKSIRRILNYFMKRAYSENIILDESTINDTEVIGQMLDKGKVLKWIEAFFEIYDKEKREKSYTELTIKVMEYIHNNVMGYIVIKDIADKLQYSENYISKQFKSDTGLRIKEYVNICKIERAKEMLYSKRYKVYEVADKLQYNTDAYFCVVFKSVTGMTVTEYINNIIK